MASLTSSITAAIPLRPRSGTPTKSEKQSVWAIGASEPDLPADKCARRTRPDGVCCREFIQEQRTLIDPDIVRDVIIGLSDGLTVPFALAAGLSSLGESRIVALGGVAELFAGAISMGIGGFLASQAERDHYRYLRHHTAQRVHHICAGEMEREVAEVLGPVGVNEKTCRAVAQSLWSAEGEESLHASEVPEDEESARLMVNTDVGLTPFLLKLGQGMEEIPNKRMYISAFTIGIGYLVGGIIPLLPYFFIPRAQVALIYSTIITGTILLIFGAVKARVTGAAQSLGGYVYGAVSVLMVGGIAAAAAFGIARVMKGSVD